MVERDLAKVETRVRFSSPAPFKSPGLIRGFWFLYSPAAGPIKKIGPKYLKNGSKDPRKFPLKNRYLNKKDV